MKMGPNQGNFSAMFIFYSRRRSGSGSGTRFVQAVQTENWFRMTSLVIKKYRYIKSDQILSSRILRNRRIYFVKSWWPESVINRETGVDRYDHWSCWWSNLHAFLSDHCQLRSNWRKMKWNCPGKRLQQKLFSYTYDPINDSLKKIGKESRYMKHESPDQIIYFHWPHQTETRQSLHGGSHL